MATDFDYTLFNGAYDEWRVGHLLFGENGEKINLGFTIHFQVEQCIFELLIIVSDRHDASVSWIGENS